MNRNGVLIASCVAALAAGLTVFYYYYQKKSRISDKSRSRRNHSPSKKKSLKVKTSAPSSISSFPKESSILYAPRSEDASFRSLSSESYPPAIVWKPKTVQELPAIVPQKPPSEAKVWIPTQESKSPVIAPQKPPSEAKAKSEEAAVAMKAMPAEPVAKKTMPAEPVAMKTMTAEPVAMKTMTAEPVVKKTLPAEDAPSPKGKIPIDSYCLCGQDIASTMADQGELNASYKVQLLPTIVKPVTFESYSPEDLTQVEGMSEELSEDSMKIARTVNNHYIIIPFLPILHAITYTSKHVQLLQELMQNYEYYESQQLDGT